MAKILFLSNHFITLYAFRKEIIKNMYQEGHEVYLSLPKSKDNIYFETPMYEGFVEYPLWVKSGEYFVLADLRKGGEDSRYFGPVSVSEIKGIVIGQFRRSGI